MEQPVLAESKLTLFLFLREQSVSTSWPQCILLLCVPPAPAVDKAFDNSKVSVAALSQSDSRRVAAYHATQAALPVGKLQSASVPTLLSGHSVKVDVAYK